MSSMIIWMMSISLSISTLVVAASLRLNNASMVLVHICVAGILCLSMAVHAIQKGASLARAKASQSAIAASDIQSLALVWIWVVLALAATYGTGVLTWSPWVAYMVAFALVGGSCLKLASSLSAHDAQGSQSPQLLSVAHYAKLAQLCAALLAILGFLVRGDFNRFVNPRASDWAATNIMFFGAVALIAISANALFADQAAALDQAGDAISPRNDARSVVA